MPDRIAPRHPRPWPLLGPGSPLALLLLLIAPPPATAAETLFSPPVFEDFEGPGAIRLFPAPARGTVAVRFKLEALIPAGEIGDGSLTITRVGLRADQGAPAAKVSLKGAITLSTTRSSSLRPRFVENAGDAPVTFFVAAASKSGRGPLDRPLYVFDLPGGFRFDPRSDGNLIVHLELQADRELQLDSAPASETRLILAADFLAPQGEALGESLVLMLALERDRPIPVSPPALALVSRRVAAPALDVVSRETAFDPAPSSRSRSDRRLEAKVRVLEQQVARLQGELERVRLSGDRVGERIQADVKAVAALVTRHYVEGALQSGLPGPSLFSAAPDGPRLEVGRDVIAESIATARSAGLDPRAAEALLAEGDGRLSRGDRALAFVSYSLAYRAALSLWRPFVAPGPERREESPVPGAEVVVARSVALNRAAPYDVSSDYPVR
jgi:hypothetical protein